MRPGHGGIGGRPHLPWPSLRPGLARLAAGGRFAACQRFAVDRRNDPPDRQQRAHRTEPQRRRRGERDHHADATDEQRRDQPAYGGILVLHRLATE
ncbi:MAG TPA: hypothetical protein VIL37_20940 [Natronosporangium sp.]